MRTGLEFRVTHYLHRPPVPARADATTESSQWRTDRVVPWNPPPKNARPTTCRVRITHHLHSAKPKNWTALRVVT